MSASKFQLEWVSRGVRGVVLASLIAALAACSGSSTSSGGSGSSGSGGGSGNGGSSTTTAGITLVTTSQSVSLDSPATVSATVLDAKGAIVPNALVTFAVGDPQIGTLAPATGKVLTDAAGVAKVLLSAASIAATGADKLTATVVLDSVTYTKDMPYQIAATSITLGDVTVGSATLSAYGTTDVRVTVLSNGSPSTYAQSVKFSSSCKLSGKATLDDEATTVNGVAIAAYRDKGCGGTDTVTVSINSGQTQKSAQITVAAPQAVSLQYISASPQVITLKGYAFAGRPDTSLVTFKVVDSNNNPIQGKSVTFSLDTSVGGVRLDNTVATTNSSGEAVATIIAGLVPTPVRVTAKVLADNLLSQSSGLSISTGLPDSDSFSLSADKWNIAGWNWDGAEAKITIRMADHFNNPVPDDTQVNFIASGGRIGQGTQGSCKTVDSACTVTISSQNPRGGIVDASAAYKFTGRVHILAYTLGEESFFDSNGNYKADSTSEMIDALGVSSDIGEAYIDNNENGVFNPAVDTLVDFNGNGVYDGPDGYFNGTLCDASFAKCGANKSPAQRTLNVFAQGTVIFAGDTPVVELYDGSSSAVALGSSLSIGHCGTQFGYIARITDVNGNPLPAGTTISFKTSDDGKVFAWGSQATVPSTTIDSIKKSPALFAGGANSFGFSVGADGSVSGVSCTDTTDGGVLYVEVNVPRPGGNTITDVPLLNLISH